MASISKRGKRASSHLISCRHQISAATSSNAFSAVGRRARMELTFQAAILRAMAPGLNPGDGAGSTEPGSTEGEKADHHQDRADGQDIADVNAGLASAGLFFVHFDVLADLAGGHG